MRPFSTVIILSGLIMVLCGACSSAQRSDVMLRDMDGKVHQPLQMTESSIAVVIFVSPDCPIANAIAPEIERLHQQTMKLGGRFYVVHARRDVTPLRAKEHAKQYGLSAPVLLDDDHRLVEALKATVTPEVVVLRGSECDVVYQGQINNLYASLGNRRDRATQHYAREAIQQAASGGEMNPAYRRPIGCYLEPVRSP